MGGSKNFAFTQSMTELSSVKVPTLTLGHPVVKGYCSIESGPWALRLLVTEGRHPELRVCVHGEIRGDRLALTLQCPDEIRQGL